MSNRKGTDKDGDNRLGTPQWRAALLLLFDSFRSEPGFQGWGQRLVCFNTVFKPRAPSQEPNTQGVVGSGIEMPELSARLMRHKHDGGHTQSLFALMLVLFRCPVPKGIGRNQPPAPQSHQSAAPH